MSSRQLFSTTYQVRKTYGACEIRNDYDYDLFSEKGENVYGAWSHPSITQIYSKDIKDEPECTWKLRMTREISGYCRCNTTEFDEKKCKECQYAKYAASKVVTTYIYIK